MIAPDHVRRVPLGLALLALAGCGEDPFGPLTTIQSAYETAGFRFTAEATVPDPNGDVLDVTLTVVNQAELAGDVTILGGECALRPRLYDNTDGTLVWSSFQKDQDCPDVEEVIELEPGAERVFERSFTVDVDDGTYLATVTIEDLFLVELAAGLVTFR